MVIYCTTTKEGSMEGSATEIVQQGTVEVWSAVDVGSAVVGVQRKQCC